MTEPALPVILQRELQKVNRLRGKLLALNDEAKELKTQLDELESDVIKRLSAKASIEPGKWSALLETSQGACRPPWKDIHQTHMEAVHEVHWSSYEEKVREEYPPSDVTRLVVSTRVA